MKSSPKKKEVLVKQRWPANIERSCQLELTGDHQGEGGEFKDGLDESIDTLEDDTEVVTYRKHRSESRDEGVAEDKILTLLLTKLDQNTDELSVVSDIVAANKKNVGVMVPHHKEIETQTSPDFSHSQGQSQVGEIYFMFHIGDMSVFTFKDRGQIEKTQINFCRERLRMIFLMRPL